MSLKSTVNAGRAAFAAVMTDTCRVTKAGVGQGTFNEATGQYDNPPARVVVYEGPCRIQVKADINSNVVETTAGEREWTYTTSQLQLPVMNPPEAIGDVGDVDVDHVAEILTAEYDPALVGRLFNIKAPYGKSQAVYRRMRVNEVVA